MLSGTILNDNMKKIAFFDFCETLVNFQTADAFVEYVVKMNGSGYMRFLEIFIILLRKVRVIAIFNKSFPNMAIEKKIKLLQIRGFAYDKLDNLAELFYKEMIKPNLIKPMIEEMVRLMKQDFEVCLVSAGYSIYLKYFAEEYRIKYVLATEIAFDRSGNRCLGTIVGKDCSRLEKVKRIMANFDFKSINFKESISYSDSFTDLPLLKLTGRGVVVSRELSQHWIYQYQFKEILWN